MYRRCLFLAFCLLLTACGRGPKGTWRASHPRGDQPAIAIELVRDGGKFSGNMFILSPDEPSNFSSGKSFPMNIKNADNKEIHFTVEFLSHEPDDFVLQLDRPVDGPNFHATMVTTSGRAEPMEFNFERLITK